MSVATWPNHSSAAPGGAPLRMTARGRMVLSVIAIVVAVVVGILMLSGTSSAGESPRVVTVHAGDTLSQIAVRELPQLPVRDGVLALIRANGLRSEEVSAGRELTIPHLAK